MGIATNGLGAYAASALAGNDAKSSSASGAIPAAAAAGATAASRALDAVAHSHKSVVAQAALSKQQAELTSDVKTALSKAGLQLTGEVSFTVDASGAVQVAGSDDDRATIGTLLKGDQSRPRLSQRVTGLVQSAAKLSAALGDSAAWVRAARSAGRNGNAVELYANFTQTSAAKAATYRIDAKSGSLTYPGVLSSQA